MGAHWLAEWILSDPEPGEWGVIAPTFEDGWATCIEGPSGLLAAFGTTAAKVKQGDSDLVRHWHRSWGELRLHNGHLVRVASADDGGLRIQGKNLKAAWADEIGLWDKWETAWNESLGYAVRMGNARIVATGTPKATRNARALVKQLLDDPNVPVIRLRTLDNAANLSPAFLADVVGRAKGTRLERQELEGELIEEVDGALWSMALIDDSRIRPGEVPDLTRVVVAVDPAVTGSATSDETGILVVGEAAGHGYVLADYSMVGSPHACMARAVRAYHDHEANCVVAEVNNGGDYIGALLRTVDPNVPYHTVRASRGKAVRAEPVAALYEQRRVHHAGSFPELEEQMCSWTPDAAKSPDRLDACFIAGTPVLTRSGEVAIETVPVGTEVWTRAGWQPVVASFLTKAAAAVIAVLLSNGRTLTGTPDHRVWIVGRGWTRLDALVCGDTLSGWTTNPPSQSSFSAPSTSGTPTGTSAPTVSTTRHPEVADAITYIETSGATTTPARKFQPGGTFTTTTTIRSTTPPTTSSWSHLPTTDRLMPRTTPTFGAYGPHRSGHWQQTGTVALRGDDGTRDTQSRPGKAAHRSTTRSAPSVSRNSSPGLPSEAKSGAALDDASTGPESTSTWKRPPAPSAAQTSVGTATVRSDPQPVPVYVVQSGVASGRQAVYDLTVAGQHEFVASGVIVHNCVWGIAEMRTLSAGSWTETYGVVRCPHCDRPFLADLHPDVCPHCRRPLTT